MVVPKTASRAAISPFLVMEVARQAWERESAGGDVIHLEVGQPSTGAPALAVAAAVDALGRGEVLGYTDALGLAALRERIAHSYRSRGVHVDADRVAVTTGASLAFVLAFLVAFDPGDRVAVCEPGYPCYRAVLGALGVEAVPLPIDSASRFQPTPDHLEAALPLDGLVVASPSNPTGSMLTDAELAGLCDWCADHGVRLVADEIYHGITYGRAAPTALAHPEGRPIVVNSFSKYHSMTGWRVGWMVLPADLVRAVELLAQNLVICPPALSQVAAAAALDATDELEGHVARYAVNRELVVEGLRRMGCTDVAPADGAFYAWADVSHLGLDSGELCRAWLEELGVAATPGVDFDPVRGRRFVRLCFAGGTAQVVEAVERLEGWVRAHRTG